MADISMTLMSNSDQLNAADLVAGPVTVTVQSVDVNNKKGADQPVTIHINGGLQPYKPCLSMRRVLAVVWGKESSGWAGRSMTLFFHPPVRYGKDITGGVRISHVDGVERPVVVKIRESRHVVVDWTVNPLLIDTYPDSAIEENRERWKKLFKGGKVTAEILIKKIEELHKMTAEQKIKIGDIYKSAVNIGHTS